MITLIREFAAVIAGFFTLFLMFSVLALVMQPPGGGPTVAYGHVLSPSAGD